MFSMAVEVIRRFFFHVFYRHKMGSFKHWRDLLEEAEFAGSEVWRVGWVLSTATFLLATNYFTDNTFWAWVLSWCKIHPFLHNSRHFLLTRSCNFVKTQCNTADLPSGRWVPTLPSKYPGHQRKQSIWLWTSKDSSVLFLVLEMMLTSTALIVAWFPDHT